VGDDLAGLAAGDAVRLDDAEREGGDGQVEISVLEERESET
jgi:hypothetical protein